MGAAQLALGTKQVQAIKGTSFGGGSAPSLGGGGGSVPSLPSISDFDTGQTKAASDTTEERSTTINVIFNGPVNELTKEAVTSVVKEAFEEGEVLIEAGTTQALRFG
jgi:hypothetical protein